MAKNKKLKYLIIVGVLGLALYIAASFISVNMFLCANRVQMIMPDTLKISYENVEFATSDGLVIKGWLFPANSDKSIILLHGWKANRYEPLPRVKFLVEAGYNVLTYDARACGESEGDLISLGYYESEDLVAAAKFLKEKGINKIAADGISQGGATIVFASQKTKDIDCIIIESCFDKLRNAVNNRFSSMLFIPGAIGSALMIPIARNKLMVDVDEIEPLKYIGNIHVPIFIVSGEKDTRTAQEETEGMYNHANQPKQLWIVPNAKHEDLFRVNPEEYKKRMLTFLSEHLK